MSNQNAIAMLLHIEREITSYIHQQLERISDNGIDNPHNKQHLELLIDNIKYSAEQLKKLIG